METENRVTDIMQRKNYSCENPPEETVKIDKTLKVRFADQAGVVKNDNCPSDFKTRPSLTKGKTSKNQFGCIEKDTEYGDCSNNYIKSSPHSCVIRENEISSSSEPCNLAGDVVIDENYTLDAKSEPSSTKEKFLIKQPDCIEKTCNSNYPWERLPHNSAFNVKGTSLASSASDTWPDAASAYLANQAVVTKDENDTLDIKSEPSSTKGKLSKTQSGCAVVSRGNDISSLFESRNFVRAFWAVMAGFGVGLFYGLFNSYTNISFYDCVCYVICLTLYLIFF